MFGFFLTVAFCAPPDVTGDDLLAMYLENGLRAQTLRVTWSIVTTSTSARRSYSKEVLRQFEEAKKGSEIPNDVQSKIDNEIAWLRSSTTARENTPPIVSRRLDYWSDRVHFQVRSPIEPKLNAPMRYGPPSNFTFPNDEATRDRLASTFESIFVLSYGPKTDNRFRSWDGVRIRGDHHAAGVRNKNPLGECHLPPLALPKMEWGGIPNPVDEFYQMLQAGQSTVLGEFPVDGAMTLLVEVEAGNSSARGFVDLQQSGIPRRLEFYRGPINMFRDHIGLSVEHPKLGASRIVTDVVIGRCATGSASVEYPQSGRIQRTSRAASPDQAISRAQPYLAVHEEMIWRVDRIEINRPMSEQNFALEFPENTIFVNQASGGLMVTGDADSVARQLVQGALPRRTQSTAWWRSRWTWGLGVVALLASWVCVRILRRGTIR